MQTITKGELFALLAGMPDDTPLIAYSDATDYVNIGLDREAVDQAKQEDGGPAVVLTLRDDFDTRQW